MKHVSNWVIRTSLALAICLLASIPAWGSPANHFIHISEKMNLSRNDIKFVVEGLGGQLRHCLSETEFIIWLPEKSSNAKFIFRQLGGAYVENFQRRISYDTTFLNATFIPDKPNTEAARIWDRYKSKVVSGGSSVSESAGDMSSDLEELAPPSDESEISQIAVVDEILLPISALYMVGEIALSIVMMESTGSLHNWTTQDEDDAIAETIIETDWMSSEALDNGVQVTWVYEIHRGVPTSFEPILHLAPVDGFTWIDDALSFFNSGSGWDGTFALGQTVASNNSANWGIILFLVMNQPGGKLFPNGGGRAYAPVKGSGGTVKQGTFAVSTFTGIHNDGVGQHELSHLFGAVDEEGATPTCEPSLFVCVRTYGYLGFPNINCQLCNLAFLCPML